MDALEFAREYNRMCKSQPETCEKCPFEGKYNCGTIIALDEVVPIVEKWSKEHPIVRNVDHVAELLEKAGYWVDKEYLSRTCPTVYSSQFAKSHCPNRYNCDECKKWWLEEYTGEDTNVLGKGAENE